MNWFEKLKLNFQMQGILAQLIIINASVFLTVNLVGNLSHLNLLPFVALLIGGYEFLFKFWTLFTYMFTHVNLGHVFWNMILFYFMSQIFFTIMGQKKLLYLYVMSGLAGGALVLAFGLFFPSSFGNSYLLGASASVMGVGSVMAVYSPNYRIYLFGIVEMAYKYFFLLTFVLGTLIDFSINTGGKISHIGGAMFGFAYGYYLKKGIDFFNVSFRINKKKSLKVVSNNPSFKTHEKKTLMDDENRMNDLLDKISKSGYDSLTKSEKEELFRLSKKN